MFGALRYERNVWEWCHDWGLRAYNRPQLDPMGLQGGTNKVLRGGCVGHSAKHARVE